MTGACGLNPLGKLMSMHILNSGNEMNEHGTAPGPSREELEELIVEAYNSMQSDGEFIFLAEDVATKLHRIADLVRAAQALMEVIVRR